MADLADIGISFPADPAGTVTIGVADLADAGIPFPADPAGTVTVGVVNLADAGIPFPLDPAGAVTIGVASLADVGMITVGVIDLVDVGVAPLADAGMAFPGDLAGVVTVGVTPLAKTGMVTVGVADGADAAPMDGEGVDIRCGDRLSTGVWCPGRTPIRNELHDQLVVSVSCHPVNVNYTMPTDDSKELFGNVLSGQMCPVISERTNWEGREALWGDSYGYHGDFDSRPGSCDYDDPRDYQEWCDWSDVEDDDGYYNPFKTGVEEEIVTSGGALGMVADAAVVAAVMCSESHVDLRVSEGPGLFDNMETEPGPIVINVCILGLSALSGDVPLYVLDVMCYMYAGLSANSQGMLPRTRE